MINKEDNILKLKIKQSYNNFLIKLLTEDIKSSFLNLNNMLFNEKIYILNMKRKNRELKIKKLKQNMKVFI